MGGGGEMRSTFSEFCAEVPGICHVVGALCACSQRICDRIGRAGCVRLPRRNKLNCVMGNVSF